MKNICSMTAVTMLVAVLHQMRAVEAFGPAGPNLRERFHAGAGKLSRYLLRMINDWVAAAIAYREHRVTLFALRTLSEAERKDFGAYRGSPESGVHRHRNVKFTTMR